MLVFAVWASISTTPNATTFRPSPGSGLMMLTFLRLTMTPLKSMICLTCDCVVHADHCNWEGGVADRLFCNCHENVTQVTFCMGMGYSALCDG